MKKIFIDTDILLDFFLKRRPFYNAALRVLELTRVSKIKSYTTVVVFTNLNYLLSKSGDKKKVNTNLKNLRSILGVLSLDAKVLDLALSSGFPDFEDAIQYYALLDQKIDCIITRNKKDFKLAKIPVMTAEEFLISEDL